MDGQGNGKFIGNRVDACDHSSFDSSFLDRRQLSKFPSVVRFCCKKDGIKRDPSILKLCGPLHSFFSRASIAMDLDRDLYDVFASSRRRNWLQIIFSEDGVKSSLSNLSDLFLKSSHDFVKCIFLKNVIPLLSSSTRSKLNILYKILFLKFGSISQAIFSYSILFFSRLYCLRVEILIDQIGINRPIS